MVWRRDPLRRQLEAELRPGEYLLGDSGYPSEPWLLTPVPGRPPPGTPESRYNKEHAAMRNVVERCIGVLKSRFRCLQHYRTLLYNPDRAATIIAACAALHNIALAACEPAFAEDEGEEPPPYEQATDVDRPPSADQPQSPVWAATQQDITLRGQLHRNRVVNLFRVHRSVHADHLRRVRHRLLRRRQPHAV